MIANAVSQVGPDALTVLSSDSAHPDAIYSRARQGSDDYRHLLLIPVSRIEETLRNFDERDKIGAYP